MHILSEMLSTPVCSVSVAVAGVRALARVLAIQTLLFTDGGVLMLPVREKNRG